MNTKRELSKRQEKDAKARIEEEEAQKMLEYLQTKIQRKSMKYLETLDKIKQSRSMYSIRVEQKRSDFKLRDDEERLKKAF